MRRCLQPVPPKGKDAMNPSEAESFVLRMTKLYPAMNPEQAGMLSIVFERYDFRIVANAINVHFENFKFITASELIAEIERQSRKHSIAFKNRYAAEVEAFHIRQKNREDEVKAIRTDNDRAAAIVAKLDISERERLKSEILIRIPFLAGKLANCDVMASPTLIALIVGRIAAPEEK